MSLCARCLSIAVGPAASPATFLPARWPWIFLQRHTVTLSAGAMKQYHTTAGIGQKEPFCCQSG